MKKLFGIVLTSVLGLAIHGAPRQALFVTGGTPTTSDLQISNRLVLLGFNVTRLTDSVSQTSDATGKDLVVISSSVGSGAVSTKFTAVPVPLVTWETAIYDELGMDSNNAGGTTLSGQTQIQITDPTHPLAAGLPAGLVTVLSAPGDIGSLAAPFPGAKVVATGASSPNAVLFAYEKGDPLHPSRITNAPARRVGIFLGNDTFRNATDAALGLFDAAVGWAAQRSGRVLFIVDSILGDGSANQASDREFTARLRSQGNVVTLADDQDPNLGTLFDGKDLILISSSVGSGNQPLNSLVISDLRTRNVPIINYEPGLYDELLFQTATTFGNPGGQVNLNITAAGQGHPLGAGNCAGSLRVATGTATMSFAALPSTIGTEAVVVAEAADAPNAGSAAIFYYEAGAHLVDGTTVTPARRLAYFLNASTVAGGYNAAGLALFDAALDWAFSPPDTTTPVNVLRQPVDLLVNEGASAQFGVKVVGSSPWSFQWFRDGTEITGANCSSYFIPAASALDNGATFFAIISNSFSVVTSRVATLTVFNDTNPPAMVLAIGAGLPATSFDLTYSELMDPNSAAEPFNYSLGNGALVMSTTLDADGRTVHFTCEPITNGTVLSLRDPVYDRAFTPNALRPGDPGSSIAIIVTDGSIRRHQFNIGSGVLVSDLTNNGRFPNFPDVVDFRSLFETPVGAGDNYGVQFLGYVTAPISGNYHFYLASDDGGVLYLSTDESANNKRLIAFEPQWAASREWTGNAGNPAGRNPAAPQNQSRTLFPSGIPLVQGQRYFIEALMKEGTGGDSLAVAWQRPGDPVPLNGSSPIPGLYLSPFNAPASLGPGEPADQAVQENRRATFTVVPTGSPYLSFQWYENDVLVASGAAFPGVATSFTTPPVTIADSGKAYYVVLNNDSSSVTSRVATLTVNVDSDPPTIVSAASLNSRNIGICFSEELDPLTASNPSNYSVNGGAITVTTATLRYDGQSVALDLSGDISSGAVVSVNNVTDLKGLAIAMNSSATVNVAGLTPIDIGTAGDPIAPGSSFTCRDGEFELIGGGSDIWGSADHGHFAYQQIAGNFDKRVKIARTDNTSPSAKAGFMVRDGLNAGDRNLHAIVMPPTVNPSFLSPAVFGRNIYESGTRVVADGPTAGWGIAGNPANQGNIRVLHPNSWVRLRRVGTIWKAYASSNGVDWIQFGQSEQLYPDTAFFMLEAGAVNNDGRTNRVLFQNLSDAVIPGASVAITLNPANTSIDENHSVTFASAASASGVPASEIGYQWQRSDGAGDYTNINAIGANGPTLTTFATLGDNGAQFRLVASVPGSTALSSAAILTVTNDVTRPRIVSASRGIPLTNVAVVFSEFVERTSAEEYGFNYSINDGAFVIYGAVLQPDGKTVVLTTDSLTNGGIYVLTAHDVVDLAGNGMTEQHILIRILNGPVQAVGDRIVIEAENLDNAVAQGSPVHSWEFHSNLVGIGSFSGIGYMQALPETGAAINEPGHVTGAPRMDYRVNFPTAGRWYIWLRGNDVVGGANSCHVGIDNLDSSNPNDNRIGNSGGATGWGDSVWKWTRDADVNTRIAWVTVPSVGLHTFNVWMREDSVIVDKILLTTDANFVFSSNTVLGPDETPRSDNTPPPRLTIALSGGNAVLTWNVPAGFARLEQADEITGTWSEVSGADPNGTIVAAGAAKKFYRVVMP